MAANPMRSTQFNLIVEPLLNEAFDGVYDQRDDEWSQIFKETPGIARNYHSEPVLFGFGMAPEVPDGASISYESGGILYNATYVYKVYGLAFALTQVLVEDGDHINMGRVYSEHLAQSIVETKETNAANIINRAFNASYTGGDNVSLISNAHPTKAGNQSNQLNTAASLSQSSVEQLLVQIRRAKDSAGKQIRLMPEKLVVSPENIFQSEVIVKSVLRSGTANNDINPIKSMGLFSKGVATISRLTSTTGWYIQTNSTKGLQLKTRRKLKKSMEGDFDTDSMRYKATERYAFGWTDWRDIYGTPGM